MLGVSAIKKIPFQANGYKLNEKPVNNKENKLDIRTIINIIAILLICAIASILLFFRKKKK